jgi:Macrocin-O-methyltransferase (TylF)
MSSTMEALVTLYSKVSMGGVENYGLPTCRAAIDVRQAQGIADPIHLIDGTGAFWQRSTTEGTALMSSRDGIASLRAVS